MRKITALLIILPLLALPAHGMDVSAASAICIEAETGRVVYERDADTRRPMASTTKIMTALCAIEAGDLSRTVTVDDRAVGVEGSSIYLEKGDTLTLHDLVRALMLESANDAAAAIAYAVGGSIEGFSAIMNEKAAALGLTNTQFTNPHGLSDDAHYTTARELAVLAAHAMQIPAFREIASCARDTITVSGEPRYLANHNKMLRLYDGAVGVKTGFTKVSGRCLVSAAERDGMTLVAVTLNAPDDWADHTAMLDLGFSTLERRTLMVPGEFTTTLPCIGTDASPITVANRDGFSAILTKGEPHEFRQVVLLPRHLWAPVEAGSIVGSIRYYDGDALLGEILLYAESGAARVRYEKSFFERLLD